MVEYCCLRCHYKTKDKTCMRRHYKKKKKCECKYKNISIEECLKLLNTKKKHICEYCEKEYSRSDNLRRHKTKCQEKRIRELELKLNKLQPSQNITNNTNCNNTTNNITNNIFINSYKNTNYDVLVGHINECITNEGGLNMRRLIDCLHNDNPENQNVYMANTNNKRIMKYENGKFGEDGRNDNGIYKFLKEIADKIENHEELSNSDLYELFNTLIYNIDGKNTKNVDKEQKEELERIKNDTIAALVKSRQIIQDSI